MKKMFFILLVMVSCVLALTACNENDNPTVSNPSETETAGFDLSGIIFEDTEYEYSGSAYTIEAFKVPEGVTVEYVNNVVTEIGEYQVKAIFKDADGNVLLEKTITITIIPAAIELYFMCEANAWSENADFLLTNMGDGTYEYAIDLEVGDQFKIATSDWSTEYGIGRLFGDYQIFAAGTEATGEKNQNVMVTEAGSYTIILNPEDNVLVIEKDGVELEKVSGTVYYVKGDLNGWSCNPTERFVYEGNSTNASVTVELKAGQQFKISDEAWTDAITYGWSQICLLNMEQFANGAEYGNVRCLADGTYKFTIENCTDPYTSFNEQVLKIEVIDGGEIGEVDAPKYEYYIRGSLNGWLDDQTQDMTAYKLVVDGETASVTVTFEADAEFKLGGLDWTQGNLGFGALTGDNIDGNFVDNNGNIKVLNAGTYTITIVGYGTLTETITITPVTE